MPLVLPKDDHLTVAETKVTKDGRKFVLIQNQITGIAELRPYEQYLVEGYLAEPLPDNKIVEYLGPDIDKPDLDSFVIRNRTEADPLPFNQAKKVPGLEEFFMVSANGDLYSQRTNRPLSQALSDRGYPQHATKIGGRSGQNVLIKTHRAVAEAFIPNPEEKPTVNHCNGIKTDPRMTNLEWNTHPENCQHAWDTGLQKRVTGPDHHSSVLTAEQIEHAKSLQGSMSTRQIGALLGVDHTTVMRAIRGYR